LGHSALPKPFIPPFLRSSTPTTPLGRRIQKNINGAITKYVYDEEDIIAELDPNSAYTSIYTHGPSIDEPLILDKAGQRYYYHTDGLGSITAITDSNNNTVQSYQYDSFGNITNQTGSLIQPYAYTGREYDPETGLYYYRARYYDPKIGRFLQEDPVWDVNLYPYAGNNPVNYRDPYGEIAIVDDATIGAGIIFGYIIATTDWRKVGEGLGEGFNQLGDAIREGINKAALFAEEHTKGKRPSTRNKHTKKKPGDKEEGDKRRPYRGKNAGGGMLLICPLGG
jgi:RHS repeat-associated protein